MKGIHIGTTAMPEGYGRTMTDVWQDEGLATMGVITTPRTAKQRSDNRAAAARYEAKLDLLAELDRARRQTPLREPELDIERD